MMGLPNNSIIRPPRLLTLAAPRKAWLILLLLLQVTAGNAWLSNANNVAPTITIHTKPLGQFRPRIRSPAMPGSTRTHRSFARYPYRGNILQYGRQRSSLDLLKQKGHNISDRHHGSSIPRRGGIGKIVKWPSQRLRRMIGFGALLCLATVLLAPSSALASSSTASTLAAESLVLEPALASTTGSAIAATTTNTAWACLEAPVPAGVELKLMKRLLFASLLGGCVGKERSSTHKHSAGVRTMALVALGACAFTICSSIGFSHLGNAKCDPSRMASNVASGVGFVGAGVITTSANGSDSRQSMVHGLTTATAVCEENVTLLVCTNAFEFSGFVLIVSCSCSPLLK